MNACHLTRHAADGGYAARYFGIWLALGFVRFDGESTLRPTAANAHRWATIKYVLCLSDVQALNQTEWECHQ